MFFLTQEGYVYVLKHFKKNIIWELGHSYKEYGIFYEGYESRENHFL